MAFKLPDLNYGYSDLEPFIDSKTMEIHHSKHHAGYTNNLNNAIEGTSFEEMDIIDKIASVQTGQADKPVEDIPMTFKVDRIRKEEITKKYGYNYPE